MHISGSHAVPGDKSLTHRALYLAGMARGESRIYGALTSLDARSTARVLRKVGVGVSALGARGAEPAPSKARGRGGHGELKVRGGPWHAPNGLLDCGNSGTTARLGLGLMAGRRFSATFTGDSSLRRRPMRRVTDLLVEMGARVDYGAVDGLPLTIRGGKLHASSFQLSASSAQVKGAVLLAGVVGGVPVSVTEPNGLSRDHTERMLRAFGYSVRAGQCPAPTGIVEIGGSVDRRIGGPVGAGPCPARVDFEPTGSITPFEFKIPGDISSAAFLLAAAVLADSGEIRLTDVGVNPTRDGILRVLARMGATVKRENEREWLGEPVADLIAGPSVVRAFQVEAGEIPSLIDEIPMLAVLASRAEGTSVFHDVGELRVKESDRLNLIATNLQSLGVKATVDGDNLHVTGTDKPPRGKVVTEGDHRIAMAFAVMSKLKGARIAIDNMECADVSFPNFKRTLQETVAS
jgi:3-phosphoshikimate 1-carboxyvinyltransferase